MGIASHRRTDGFIGISDLPQLPPPAAPDGSRPVVPGKYPRMDKANFPRLVTELIDADDDRRADANISTRVFWDDRGTPDDESDDLIVPVNVGIEICRGVRRNCRDIPEQVINESKIRATFGL